MKLRSLLFIAALAVVIFPMEASGASTTVTFKILPGEFTAEMSIEEEYTVLTIDDERGNGAGWLVTVECDCSAVPVGDLEHIVGQEVNAEGGPHRVENSFSAEPGFGLGRYKQRFLSYEGSTWTITVSPEI